MTIIWQFWQHGWLRNCVFLNYHLHNLLISVVYGLIFCKIQGRIYCKILIFKRDCVCFVTRAEIQRCQRKNYDPSRPSSRCSSRGFVEKKEKKKQQLCRACNSLTFQLNLLILGETGASPGSFWKDLLVRMLFLLLMLLLSILEGRKYVNWTIFVLWNR